MKKTYLFLSTIFICLSIINHAQTNWYVSTTGQDINGNGGFSIPFKTVTYASTKASPGDTIFVMNGTYNNTTYGTYDIWKTEQAVRINNFNPTGIPNYLTIKPYNNQPVKFKCDGDFIIQVKNSSYVSIEGFEVEGEVNNIPLDSGLKYQFIYKDVMGNIQQRVPVGSTPAQIATMTLSVLSNIERPTYFNTSGISINNSHHVKILNNHVYNMPGEGIRSFTSDYLNIIGNTVYNCSRRSATGVHGLSIYTLNSNLDPANATNPNTRVLIAQNLVYNNFNEVYSWSETKTLITPHIDEGKGITIQRCTPSYSWTVGKIRIENNISYNNGFSGIHVNSGNRIEIVNNTVFENNQTSQITLQGDQQGISLQDANDFLITNNIIQANPTINNGFALKLSANSAIIGTNSITNNFINGNMSANSITLATNTFTGSPQFVNPTISNFNLQPTSFAINNALLTNSPLNDFYNNIRGSMPDIGAIEYFLTTNITKSYDNEALSIYPNPFSNTIFIQNIPNKNNIEIYNSFGQKIQTIEHTSEAKSLGIDLKHLSSGIYIIKIDVNYYKIIKN